MNNHYLFFWMNQWFLITIISCVTFFTTSDLYSQNNTIDSLLVLLEKTEIDTSRAILLNEVSWELHTVDLEKSMKYANQALSLSEKLAFDKGIARAYNLLAIEKSLKGNNAESHELNQKAYCIAKAINDDFLISATLNDIAIYSYDTGDLIGALEGYQKSFEISKRIKDTLNLVITLSNISNIHFQLGNIEESNEYSKRLYSYYKSSSQPKIKMMAYANLGYMLLDEEKFDKAIKQFDKALLIAQTNKDQLIQIEMLLSMSYANSEKGQVEVAYLNCIDALDIAKSYGSVVDLIYVLGQLSEIQNQQNDLLQAIESAKQGLSMALEVGLLDQQLRFHSLLSDLHQKQANYQLAFSHLDQLTTLRDSLNTNEQKKQVLLVEAEYQNERKEIENQLLREQAGKNMAILNQKKAEIAVTIIILFGFCILSLMLYFAHLKDKNFNEALKLEVQERTEDLEKMVTKLEKSNSELESFAYIASHDLKEPIRNISSFTNLALRQLTEEQDRKIGEFLNYVATNAKQMHLLVEDVLEYSKMGHANEEATEINLMEMINKVEQTLKTTIDDKNAVIKHDDLPNIYASPTPFFILLKNLIENGIKYNESKVPIIHIRWEKEESSGYQKIIITDNGIGIEPEYQSKIFEMFKRLHNRSAYKGSGLGLSICKKIAISMKGQLLLNSVLGKGSRFTIRFPNPKIPQTQLKEVSASETITELI